MHSLVIWLCTASQIHKIEIFTAVNLNVKFMMLHCCSIVIQYIEVAGAATKKSGLHKGESFCLYHSTHLPTFYDTSASLCVCVWVGWRCSAASRETEEEKRWGKNASRRCLAFCHPPTT